MIEGDSHGRLRGLKVQAAEGQATHDCQSSCLLYRRKLVMLPQIKRRRFSGRKFFIGYALNPYAMKFIFVLSLSGRHDRRKRGLFLDVSRGRIFSLR